MIIDEIKTFFGLITTATNKVGMAYSNETEARRTLEEIKSYCGMCSQYFSKLPPSDRGILEKDQQSSLQELKNVGREIRIMLDERKVTSILSAPKNLQKLQVLEHRLTKAMDRIKMALTLRQSEMISNIHNALFFKEAPNLPVVDFIPDEILTLQKQHDIVRRKNPNRSYFQGELIMVENRSDVFVKVQPTHPEVQDNCWGEPVFIVSNTKQTVHGIIDWKSQCPGLRIDFIYNDEDSYFYRKWVPQCRGGATIYNDRVEYIHRPAISDCSTVGVRALLPSARQRRNTRYDDIGTLAKALDIHIEQQNMSKARAQRLNSTRMRLT